MELSTFTLTVKTAGLGLIMVSSQTVGQMKEVSVDVQVIQSTLHLTGENIALGKNNMNVPLVSNLHGVEVKVLREVAHDIQRELLAILQLLDDSSPCN